MFDWLLNTFLNLLFILREENLIFCVPEMLFMQFISDGELEVVEIVFFEGKRRKSKAIEAAILQC